MNMRRLKENLATFEDDGDVEAVVGLEGSGRCMRRGTGLALADDGERRRGTMLAAHVEAERLEPGGKEGLPLGGAA